MAKCRCRIGKLFFPTPTSLPDALPLQTSRRPSRRCLDPKDLIEFVGVDSVAWWRLPATVDQRRPQPPFINVPAVTVYPAKVKFRSALICRIASIVWQSPSCRTVHDIGEPTGLEQTVKQKASDGERRLIVAR